MDRFPGVSESRIITFTTPTSVCNSLATFDSHAARTQLDTKSEGQTKDSAFTTDNFTKPLKLFNKEPSYLAHISSLRSEYSEKFEPSPSITEIKSNGALVKSILAEFEKPSNKSPKPDGVTPANTEHYDGSMKNTENVIEENYMTMTPKKSILAPQSLLSDGIPRTLYLDLEENPYMEMTQSADMNFLGLNACLNINEPQPYEVVCFSDGNIMEPVYMELNQNLKLSDRSILNNTVERQLPDILQPPQDRQTVDNKSDSSDADDEASKDLDSLDTPSQPRFSLSDSFRPASYYLGVTQATPELQDSSDSELVSPPPIPTSPLPIHDLDNVDDSMTSNFSYNEQLKKEPLRQFSDKRSSNITDNDSSLCTDAENKYNKQTHNSDSEVEFRIYQGSRNKTPVLDVSKPADIQSFKDMDGDVSRRSKNFIGISEVSTTSLKDYRNARKPEFSDKNFENICHDYENLYMAEQPVNSERNKMSAVAVSSPVSIHTRESSRDTTTTHSAGNSILSFDDYLTRARPESCVSNSAEIVGLLQASACSTPTIVMESFVNTQDISSASLYFQQHKDGAANPFTQPAPYYYSDLSMNTSHTDNSATMLMLNNQRGTMNGSKRDITHIINPIRCNGNSVCRNAADNTFKLAAEARSVSVDFLNLADKSGQIDKKNIYESDTLKRLKAMDSISSLQSNPETRNIYPTANTEKFNSCNANTNDSTKIRRSYSLEGLLENVLSESTDVRSSTQALNITNSSHIEVASDDRNADATEGSYLWEEDSVWHERLRSASQRHTKSLDNLDCVCELKKLQKKQARGITRLVTYVNDNVYHMPVQDKQQKDVEKDKPCMHCKSETKTKEGSFIIDREKLRQWDLLSSAPSDAQSQGARANITLVESGEGVKACPQNEQGKTEDQGKSFEVHCIKCIYIFVCYVPNHHISASSLKCLFKLLINKLQIYNNVNKVFSSLVYVHILL